jgi:hypothetical protein
MGANVMNALAQYLGLPTYPVKDAMQLDRRTLEEYQWLIDRGFFSSWHQHHLIIKQHGRYQLLRNFGSTPELEAEAPTLDALIKDHNIPIAVYQWHINWLDDNEPAQGATEDTIDTGELEALAQLQELEPA